MASLAHPTGVLLPELPYSGTLQKRSETLGVWQSRAVELDYGSLRYFKDGHTQPRQEFRQGDVFSVVDVAPSTIVLHARVPGGHERKYEFRAASPADMRLWVAMIKVGFALTAEKGRQAATDVVHLGPPESKVKDNSANNRRPSKGLLGRMGYVAVGAAAAAVAGTGKVVTHAAKVAGKEEWMNEKVSEAKRVWAQSREQIERQMEEALASSDDGRMEMLLDTALSSRMFEERAPASLRRVARTTAGRHLREATDSGNPKQLKGAMLMAKRLHASDIPEFEPALQRYREVMRIPTGWDLARMLEERKAGEGKLLARPDVSNNEALRLLVQLIFDRTFRRVETRDRQGQQLPNHLQVVQVTEVQNEAKWFDYLMRRASIKEDLEQSGEADEHDGSLLAANAATENPLAEAAALFASGGLRIRVPPGAKPGQLAAFPSPITGEKLHVPIPAAAAEQCQAAVGGASAGAEIDVPLLESLPGPLLETDVNEAWLFHGTHPFAANRITADDFRVDLAGTSRGSLYGRGVYLAENCTKADEYSQPDHNGLYTLLLCRATLGRLLYSAEVRPDPRQCEAACLSGKYHGILGDRKACRGTFREFVVFDEDQIYPAYVINYHRVMP